jgi:putative protein-disulfide isomerase
MTKPLLWYFADPMCSWCWGFTPVVKGIKESFDDRVNIAIVLGGLRPWTRDPVTADQREGYFHHWREVHQRSGQAFLLDGALPEGFVYDTEPPCRAVITMGSLNLEEIFPYFKSIQSAFYTEGKDVTQETTLAHLAKNHGLGAEAFRTAFHSEEMKKRTSAHFQQTHDFGVKGFPTLILQDNEKKRYHLVTSGYQPLEEAKKQLETCLEK